MCPNRLFIAVSFVFGLCAADWAQPLMSLTYTRKTLYCDFGMDDPFFGMDDSIKVHNPNRIAVKLDFVEVWSEIGEKSSMVGLIFQPLAMPVYENGWLYVYNAQEANAISQGIFVWNSVRNLSNRNLAVQPNGDAWISGFSRRTCPVCKQSAASNIRDTVRFKFIFHHSAGVDTILVITDNRIGLSLQPVLHNASTSGSGVRDKFDFLGRRTRIPGFQSMSHVLPK